MFQDSLKSTYKYGTKDPKKNFLEEKRPTEGRERGPKEPIPAYERLINYIKSLVLHHLIIFPKSLFRQIPKKSLFSSVKSPIYCLFSDYSHRWL